MIVKTKYDVMQYVYAKTDLDLQDKPTCIAFELSLNHKLKIQRDPDILANCCFLSNAILHINQAFVGLCHTITMQLVEFLMETKITPM